MLITHSKYKKIFQRAMLRQMSSALRRRTEHCTAGDVNNCNGGRQLRTGSALRRTPCMRITFHSQNKAKTVLHSHTANCSLSQNFE